MADLLSVRADVKEVERWLTRLERQQLPFATALALTRTAQHIQRKTIPAILPRVFERPTRWTQQGFFIEPARKTKLQASINIKDRPQGSGTPAFNYLAIQQSGGQRRRAKGHEVALRALGVLGRNEFTSPGRGMRLTRSGDLSKGVYQKIISDVKSTLGRRRGQGEPLKNTYFFHPNLKPKGIYIRTGKRGKLRLALIFLDSQTYSPIFDFPSIVERAARKRFPIEFRRSMKRAIATAGR